MRFPNLRRLLLLPGFLLLFAPLKGQFLLQGRLRDSLSRQPLAFAPFIVKGSTRGGMTDESGRFGITVQQLPATLVFTLLGYKPREVSWNDTAARTIGMEQKAQQLGEVVVSAQKVQTLREKDAWFFVDFRFYDEFLLGLAGRRAGAAMSLLLMDTEGNTIASLEAPASSESLYLDCLGAIHVLTKDSSYQVYYDYTRLHLIYPAARETFLRIMEPCKGRIEDHYYFGRYAYRGLRIDYTTVNWYRKGDFVPLRSIADSFKVKGFQTNYDLGYFLAKRRQRPFPDPRYAVSRDFLAAHLDSFRLTEPLPEADQRWLSPVKAPLHLVAKEIVIFNFVDSLIERFEKNGQPLGAVPFTLARNKHLQHEFLVDAPGGKIYALEERRGLSALLHVDPVTGNVLQRFEVPGRTFITHPQVRDGVLYFLHRDPMGDAPRKISRMYLCG